MYWSAFCVLAIQDPKRLKMPSFIWGCVTVVVQRCCYFVVVVKAPFTSISIHSVLLTKWHSNILWRIAIPWFGAKGLFRGFLIRGSDLPRTIYIQKLWAERFHWITSRDNHLKFICIFLFCICYNCIFIVRINGFISSVWAFVLKDFVVVSSHWIIKINLTSTHHSIFNSSTSAWTNVNNFKHAITVQLVELHRQTICDYSLVLGTFRHQLLKLHVSKKRIGRISPAHKQSDNTISKLSR